MKLHLKGFKLITFECLSDIYNIPLSLKILMYGTVKWFSGYVLILIDRATDILNEFHNAFTQVFFKSLCFEFIKTLN